MITIILQLVIIAIILGLIIWLVGQLPFMAPYAQIIRVIAICLFVIYCIYLLIGLMGHVPSLIPSR